MATQPSEPDRRAAADGSPRKRLANFVQRARERAEQAKAQFSVHGISYCAVNGLLALINLLTSPGFLWSAVLALQQLALDLPRLRAAPAEEPGALLSLRGKAQELTQYLDDLRAGRNELEAAGLRVRG